MKTILIIGSNSFTGSHFVNLCLDRGFKVIGISRSNEYPRVLLPYLYARKDISNFSFFKLDVNKDLLKILQICDENEPEIIANFAAQGEVRTSWQYPSQWYETNTLAIVKLTDELRKRTYLRKYLTASTPEVYGSTSDNLKENNNFSPSTPYAASKLAGDLHLLTLFKRYDFPVVFSRSANVYGIHQQLYRIIPRTIIYLKMNKKIQLHGGGKSERAFIHIRDVAEATLKIVQKGKNGDAYHISPEGDDHTIGSLVKSICEMMNCDFESSIEMVNQNFGQDSKYSLSSEKIRQELGWRPTIQLADGITEMIGWVNNNWHEIKKMPLDYTHQK